MVEKEVVLSPGKPQEKNCTQTHRIQELGHAIKADSQAKTLFCHATRS